MRHPDDYFRELAEKGRAKLEQEQAPLRKQQEAEAGMEERQRLGRAMRSTVGLYDWLGRTRGWS